MASTLCGMITDGIWLYIHAWIGYHEHLLNDMTSYIIIVCVNESGHMVWVQAKVN